MVFNYYDLLNRFYNSYTKRIIIEAWQLLLDLLPYLIISILITSVLKIFLNRSRIFKIFKTINIKSIALSSLIGVISPLGSYVTIPLSGFLIKIGISIPVVIAFLISSPLIDINLFFLTAGAFGYKMAISRAVSAFIIGVGSGFFLKILINKNIIDKTKIIKNFENNRELLTNYEIKFCLKNILIEIYKMTKYMTKYISLAILLSAIIKILIPSEFITKIFSRNLFTSVLISTSAGIPFYICGGAAIPIVQQLAELGIPQGSILAFFISGPITKISNIILLKTIFSNKIFFFYLFYGICSSLIIGLIYNLFLT